MSESARSTDSRRDSENDIILGSLIYDKDTRNLILINHNTKLKKKILLLGYSEKRSHHDVIGQFG